MKKRTAPDVSIAVLKKFRLIFGAVRQQFREVEETCGVTGSQLWILKEVSGSPGIGVSELAGRLAIHQSTCSQLVEKLVTKGFLEKERSQEDQRRVGLQLTQQAKAALAAAPGPATGVLPDALAQLPIEALETLDGSLADLITTLKNIDEKFAEKPLSDL